ncbi:MAG: acylphosphatase [Nocardioidaceae bacterium]|nr:acylphosphatase [Nocardioidaceae bacterium]
MVRRRVVVHGEVQGVFFRDSCQAEAQAAGVAGWVRNTSAGTVEAVFEGPADSVEQLVGWCRTGSDQARVDQVDVEHEEPRGETAFVVR